MKILKSAVHINAKQQNKKLYNRRNREIPEHDIPFIRHFLMGILTRDEVCEWVEVNIRWEWIEVPTAAKLARLVIGYYSEYGEAPKTRENIELLLFDAFKSGKFSQDEKEELENLILPNLSEEFEKLETFNVQQLINRMKRYLYNRSLELWEDDIKEAREQGDFETVDKLKQNPPKEIGQVDNTLNKYLLTADQWKEKDLPKPKMLMSPWLREGQTNFINADIGTGKTLLGMGLGYVLGCENFDEPECEIGSWQVNEPVGVVYLDGEMGEADLRARYDEYQHLGEQVIPMMLFPRPDVERETEQEFDLGEKKNQKWLLNWLKRNPEYKVVILDSVQTLFSFESENDAAEWNRKVSPLLRGFRSLGVANIVQDHPGKDASKGGRGTSAKKAMAENIFELKDHPQKIQGQAWFTVSNKGKQRAYGTDRNRPFTIRFDKDEQAGETFWEITDDPKSDRGNNQDLIKVAILRGDKFMDIAKHFSISTGRVSQIRTQLKEEELLNDDKQPTREGFDFLNKWEENIE